MPSRLDKFLNANVILKDAARLGRYLKTSRVGKWITTDPPRAVQTGLAAYAAYKGYQGGYIPYNAFYHATRAYDRRRPYRQRFRLRHSRIQPSNTYLRRQAYRARASKALGISKPFYTKKDRAIHRRALRRGWINTGRPQWHTSYRRKPHISKYSTLHQRADGSYYHPKLYFPKQQYDRNVSSRRGIQHFLYAPT